VESTVDAMESSAPTQRHRRRDRALIRQHSYEVGGEFVERFIEADAENAAVLHSLGARGPCDVRPRGFIRMRLENAGVLMIDDIGVDTYSDERFTATALGAPQGAGLRPARSCHRAGGIASTELFHLERKHCRAPFRY
jgi:hypothetical protein